MSFDATITASACRAWFAARLLHLPRSPAEPVVWIDDDDSLRLYHPAVDLNNMRVPPAAWDTAGFHRMIAQLVPHASEIITRAAEQSGVPGGFYSGWPESAMHWTYTAQEAAKEDAKKAAQQPDV